jgi:predicted glycogen debranching enzyme
MPSDLDPNQAVPVESAVDTAATQVRPDRHPNPLPDRRSEPVPDPLPAPVHFGRAICGDLEQAERREWWLTNGLGSYAAGTLAGSLTRRYHGLLIANLKPPLGRFLVFAKADATLIDRDHEWPLFSNRWADGALDPVGHVHIESFHLAGRVPVWRFTIGDLRIEQRIWMDAGVDRVHVGWRLLAAAAGRAPRLRVALLINARDHHALSHVDHIEPQLGAHDNRLQIVYEDWFRLHIQAQGGRMHLDPGWIENFDLPLERERGLDDLDHHLCIGHASLLLEPGLWCGISAAVGELDAMDLGQSLQAHQDRDRHLLAQARNAEHTPLLQAPDWVMQLVLAADSFLFARPLPAVADGESVIAGYPWFGDWGRDTMIALPGLTLVTGRLDSARRILQTFANFIEQGMLPNMFPDSGETPEYNSVDAALWFIEAWRAYIDASGDQAALEEVFPVLESIIRSYRDGTRYGIAMDPADGLIRAGKPGVQLTWMDAKVSDWVVTPRMGKPVEVNALWFNALVAMQAFSTRLGLDASRYAALAERTASGFKRFVRADGDGLLDLLDGPNGDDTSLRPNQILAVSLPATPLSATDQASVVAACGRLLLSSYGLRSLAPGHADYRGQYIGDIWARDGSYHQGTIWGWLLGHYALAEHRVTGNVELALSRLAPLADHLCDAGLGSISEIFDGDAPHKPRGTPLQAWSVACTLEAWWRLSSSNASQQSKTR